MKARAVIDPGICGFKTVVTAETEDGRNVTFNFNSECETIKKLGEQINAISPVDAIMTLGPGENPMLLAARKLLQTAGCCDACVVPAGAVKIMHVVSGMAIPKDVTLTITKE